MLLRSIAKYTKELADAKAENDALRDDVAGMVVVWILSAILSIITPMPPLAWIIKPPRLTDAEQDYFTLSHWQKQLEGTQKYINEQCR